jgi:membrane associated rhomboid family serine protease
VFPIRDNIPTDRRPYVTIALILANALVYFLLQDGRLGLPSNGFGGDWPTPTYAFIPCELTGRGVCQTAPGGPATLLTVFTGMFMHGSIVHLGGNMLFLWIFGNNVEDSMGSARFLLFYLLAGVAATALQVLVSSGSAVPNLGASGAIAGVLGAYLVLFPRARVVTFVFIVFFFTVLELPAIIFLGIWIGEQLLFGYFGLTQPSSGGGVAYFAHIGGFAFGITAIKLFADEARRRSQLQRAGMA